MNRPQRAEIREGCFIIIPLSCDSSPKVVFIRHSSFPEFDMTDWRSTLFTQVCSNAEPSFNKIDQR